MLLADLSNPAAVRLAGGAMRELLDELALAASLLQVRPGGLKVLVSKLRDRAAKRATLLRVDQPSPAHVSKLLDDLDSFFRDCDDIYPKMRTKARQALADLSVAGADSAEMILQDQVERWLHFSGAFSRVLHHPQGADRRELEQLVAEFESFLLDWLTPETFDDFAAMDAFLAQGPPHV